MEINLEMLKAAYSRIAYISHYHIFIFAVLVDIMSGFVKAGITKNLDSKIGLNGILKHLSVVGLVFLVCPYLWLLGYSKIAIFFIYSITLTYCISVAENYDVIAPDTLPKWISQFLRRTKEELGNVDIDILKKDKNK